MLWLESGHSLLLCSHIVHTCASLNGLRYCSSKFSYLSHEISNFHFLGAEIAVFCEATTKLKIGIGTKPFFKNTRPPYMNNFPTGVSRTFPSTRHEKDKFLPNRLEAAKIWTTGTWYNASNFLIKSFIGSQHAISSQIHFNFSEA